MISHLESSPLSNYGIILALMQFRLQADDKTLETHLKIASANALYTSKIIQNELIFICGNFIQNKILESIRKAGFYSLIADEATDASNHSFCK